MFKILCGLLLILIATAAFADNNVDGFRGIKWGSKIESISGLADPYGHKWDIFNNDQKGFARTNYSELKQNIGAAKLGQLQYFFDDDGKFYAVIGSTADYGNGEHLVEALTVKFGKPDSIVKLSNSSYRYFWIGKTVAVVDSNSGFYSCFTLVNSKSEYAKRCLKQNGYNPDGL